MRALSREFEGSDRSLSAAQEIDVGAGLFPSNFVVKGPLELSPPLTQGQSAHIAAGTDPLMQQVGCPSAFALTEMLVQPGQALIKVDGNPVLQGPEQILSAVAGAQGAFDVEQASAGRAGLR